MSALASVAENEISCKACSKILKGTYYQCDCCSEIRFCSSCIDQYEYECEEGCGDLLSKHPYVGHIFLRLSTLFKTVNNSKPTWIHHHVKCNNCTHDNDIVGYRYFCTSCAISLCEACELAGVHQLDHSLLKMVPPQIVEPEPNSYLSNRYNRNNEMNNMRDAEDNSTTAETDSADGISIDSNIIVDDDAILFGTNISYNTLKAMLARENDLRLSEPIQQQYRERGYDAYVDITEALQYQVAEEFNLDLQEGMDYLQTAEMLVRSNKTRVKEVRNLSLYRKFNRCYDGSLHVGDIAPLLSKPLYLLSGSEQTVQSSYFINDYLTKTVNGIMTSELLNK